MDEIAGLIPTGKRLRGPASDLVELNGENGFRHTAVVFHPEFREHRSLNESFEMVRGFLESPWVTGLVELGARDGAAFVYPCGECWSVAEITRTLADMGQVAGIRAGLELMYAAGQILSEAAETGESEGVYSHGGLTPWRVMLRRDGQVQIIGHALPQVEILMFHEDGQRVPREDSFRYCPPERIEQGPEDLSSDLFGLSLIAFELMTGRPVYDGLVNDIRQQAARGEGSRRLFRFRDKLPDAVRECLAIALRRETGDRFASGSEFLSAVSDVLSRSSTTGASLMDLMNQVTQQQQRVGSRPDNASTMMASVGEVQRLTAEAEAHEGPSGPVPSDERPKRWSAAPDRRSREPRSPRSLRVSQQSLDEPPVIERLEPEVDPHVSNSGLEQAADSVEPLEDSPPEHEASDGGQESSRRGRAGRTSKQARRPRRTHLMEPEEIRLDAASTDRPEKRNVARRSSNKDVVDAILGASSAASSMAERVIQRRRGADGRGESDDLDEGATRFRKGRAPRRSRTRPPEDTAPPAEPIEAAVEADSGPGVGAAPVESEDEKIQDVKSPDTAEEPTTEVETVDEDEVAAEGVQEASRAEAAERTEAFTPEQLRQRLEAAERAEEEARPAVKKSSPGKPSASVAQKKTQTLQVRITESGDVESVEVQGAQTLAELIATWMGHRFPMRTDLMGRVKSWPRLRDREDVLPGSTQVTELDESRVLDLVWVSNEERMVELIVGLEEEEDRMVMSMASAIPVIMLVAHLTEWLGLGEESLRLMHDTRVLGGSEILADLPNKKGRISLKLQRTEET